MPDDLTRSDEAIELPPFDHGHKSAIRECRFKTVNVARTVAIIYDADELRIKATGCDYSRYERARIATPGVYDYEARSADERIIEFVAGLSAHRSESPS